MVASGRNLSFSRAFREGAREFLELRNLVILIAVPVVVALVALVEGNLEAQGVIGPFTRNQTLRMLLWNVTIVVSLLALVRGCFSFVRTWSFERLLPGRGTPGDLLGAMASLFITFFGIMCIMGAAVMQASDGFNIAGFLFLVGWCAPVLLWAVCLATLLSTAADGPGAAWLGSCVFVFSLLPGLFGRGVSQWIMPSNGRLVSNTINGYFHPEMLLVLLLHSVFYIILAIMVYGFRSREASRRWQ
ncbi:MAG: hypothetical protein R6V62_00440 [Candidatus Fermentibacteraceae bacterium]